MKYKHKKTGLIVSWSKDESQYTNYPTSPDNSVWLNKEMVEDSSEWIKLPTDIDKIKKLQDIQCLSINDVGKVFVTANRFRNNGANNEYELERQGRELLEIVKNHIEKQEVEYRKIAEELKTTRI